ncbi:MAG: hypothetical protein AB7P04_11240 [Bacteriovoracia bacterium]
MKPKHVLTAGLFGILALITLAASPARAEEDPKPMLGYWVKQDVGVPVFYGGRECQTLFYIARDVMSAIRAKNFTFMCDRFGANIRFESLQSQPTAEEKEVTVDWRAIQFTHFEQNVMVCNLVADVWDAVLAKVVVRNLSSGVFCGSGNGSVIYKFDTLIQKM